MFGLEEKSKKNGEFLFDLEKELKDAKACTELENRLMKKVQEIKRVLRDGSDKESYEQLGMALYGYVSLLKVVSMIGAKAK